jgi:hypothetical protein
MREGGKMAKLLSFDLETNGLWGQGWAVGAVVRENGREIARFTGRCPIQGEVNPWVAENVLPQCESIEVNYGSYEEMCRAFAEFYTQYKEGAVILTHVGFPVETTLLRDMRAFGFIGEWDAPFPLQDMAGIIAGYNLAKGTAYDPTSVDAIIRSENLSHLIGEFDGGTHNPLYDATAAAVVFEFLSGLHR